mgnify:CR=1 FL=1
MGINRERNVASSGTEVVTINEFEFKLHLHALEWFPEHEKLLATGP